MAGCCLACREVKEFIKEGGKHPLCFKTIKPSQRARFSHDMDGFREHPPWGQSTLARARFSHDMLPLPSAPQRSPSLPTFWKLRRNSAPFSRRQTRDWLHGSGANLSLAPIQSERNPPTPPKNNVPRGGQDKESSRRGGVTRGRLCPQAPPCGVLVLRWSWEAR